MRIEMIKPLEGQSNWSNAINGNFQKLMTQLKSTSSEMQQLRREIEGLVSLHIQEDNFLYITPIEYDTTIITAYVISYEDWVNPADRNTEFKPEEYIGYLAWFVQTPNDAEVQYQGYSWKTGDLLIVYKQSISTIDNFIQQWKSIMGGYFLPTEHEIDEDTGKITTKYRKVPSLSTESTAELFNPSVNWQPIFYNTSDGTLMFRPYYVDEQGRMKQLGAQTQSITMIFPVPGGSHYAILADNGETSHELSFNIGTTNDSGGDFDSAGFDIHFSDDNNNILYLPYSYDKNNMQYGMLYITVQRGSYTGNIHVRLNVFRPV